jgi:hypothetical protein
MLHYWATRIFDAVDPIVVGRLLAQVQIAVAVLVAAPWLFEVFGFGATLAGLSFFIWGRPFLIWFIDGYYSTTPALLCQLALVSWCLAFTKRTLANASPPTLRWADIAVAMLLAFLGVFSEWIALFGNGVAIVAFAAMSAMFLRRRPLCARQTFAIAPSIAAGSVAAIVSMVLLYGSKMGYAFFWRQFMSRVDERTGEGGLVPYTGTLIQQMQMGWPRGMLLLLAFMVVTVFACSLVYAWRRPARNTSGDVWLPPLAVLLAFGSAVTYSYRLRDLFTGHWWFIGTWTVGMAVTVCAFAHVIRAGLHSILEAKWASISYSIGCLALVAGAVGWNLEFANLDRPEGARIEGTVVTPATKTSHEIYRALGRALPRDGAPLIVADMPELFEQYPFATAYLLRPVVRYIPDGALLKLGTSEDARPALLERGGFVYVAYDGSFRQCAHQDVTPPAWRFSVPLAICRVPAATLAENATRVFRAVERAAVLAQWVSEKLATAECCDEPQRLLTVTRLIESRLRLRAGDEIEAVRQKDADALRALVHRWQQQTSAPQSSKDASVASPSLLGMLVADRRGYVIVSNLGGAAMPDFHSRVDLLVNSNRRRLIAPYQARTNDGKAILPFSVIEVAATSAESEGELTIELVDGGARLARSSNARVVRIPASDPAGTISTDALLTLSTGCSGPPAAPGDLLISATSRRALGLSWVATYGAPASYVLQGGTAPGLTNVTNSDLGDTATTMTATRITPGTYYLRIRGKNGCGTGAPSNEVVAVVQ